MPLLANLKKRNWEVELAGLIKESDESQDWFAKGRVSYEASAEIHRVIASIGRTEDVRLSPANSRLAIAAFSENRVYLFSLSIECSVTTPAIELKDYLVLSSPHFAEPHGLCFLDNDHILVCNRAADLCLFQIPAFEGVYHSLEISPLKIVSGSGTLRAKVKSPGSVSCYPLSENRYRALVCNNHWSFVSSHIITIGKSTTIENQGHFSDQRMCIPDGISVSPDEQWMAISNHVYGEVLIYRNTPAFRSGLTLSAVLGGMVCPHGLKFTPDGKLVVADGASQYLHVFDCDSYDWDGDYAPVKSIRMLHEDTFYNGRYGVREGGIKGIDIDSSGRLLLTSHRLDVLGFYDLAELLSSPNELEPGDTNKLIEERDASIISDPDLALTRRWTHRQRLHSALNEFRWQWWRLQLDIKMRTKLLSSNARNKLSNQSLLGSSGPVVSLTTHARRIHLVHHVIETIGMGKLKPSRIVLWLTDQALYAEVPQQLLRLKSRGLEIYLAQEYGPHSKFFPYIESCDNFDRPLVTADDDSLYCRDWLYELMEAYNKDPETIHAHWVMRMGLSGSEISPYGSWPHPGNSKPSHSNFILGVAGVIYTPQFLVYLKHAGDQFRQSCPKNDDIWLTVNALRGGFKVAQIKSEPSKPMPIPGSQNDCLYHFNETNGAVQAQLRETFTGSDVITLIAADDARSGALYQFAN